MKTPSPVKLVCGILARDERLIQTAKHQLQRRFGHIDHESAIIPFTFTEYYATEMGSGLLRQYASFEPTIDPGALADIKNATIRIEQALSYEQDGKRSRKVNLDPGYITPAKLVLASTKNYSHRIYLRDGIYAELTLTFNKRGCVSYPWTYADYRAADCTEFLLAVRRQLIQAGHPNSRANPSS